MSLDILKNELHYYVDLLRMKSCEKRTFEQSGSCVTALHNIIRTMRLSRHDKICAEDFSRLDFGNIPLNGIHFSKDGEQPCRFDECRLNEWSFMSGHTDYVSTAVWSPDGKFILSGSADGSAILWDVQSGLIRAILHESFCRILTVSFSSDGERCLISTKNGGIKICDSKTGNPLLSLKIEGYVNDAIFSSDSEYCLVLLENGTVIVINSRTGDNIDRFKSHSCLDSGKAFIRVSSKDTYCLIGSARDNHIVELWDFTNRKYIRNIEVPSHWPSLGCLAFSKDEKRCVLGFNDGTVKIWDIAKENYVQETQIEGFISERDDIDYSINGNYCLTSVRSNGKAIICDTETGKLICELKEKLYFSSFLSIYNNHFITSSDHNTIKIWDMKTGKCIKTLGYEVSVIERVIVSNKGKYILIVLNSGVVYVYSNVDGRFLYSSSDIMAVLSLDRVSFSENDEYLLVCDGNDAIMWRLNDGNCLQVLKGHEYTVSSCAFSEDNSYCITGSGDHTAKIWDTRNGKCIQTLNGHSNWVYSVALYKKLDICLTGSADKTAKIWDIKTGKCLKTLHGHKSWIRSAAFSPNGDCCITSDEYSAKIWNVTTGECLYTIPTDSDSTIRFSKNEEVFFLIFNKYSEAYDLKTKKLIKGLRTADTSSISGVDTAWHNYWSFPYCLQKVRHSCTIYEYFSQIPNDNDSIREHSIFYNVYGLHINNCTFHNIIADITTREIIYQYNGDIEK